MKPQPEKMLVPSWIETLGRLEVREATYGVSEAEATLALSPVVTRLREKGNPLAESLFFAALARTAVLFAVDHEELAVAAISAEALPPQDIELPPLPYPRIAVESSSGEAWDFDGEIVLLAFLINEYEPGERWQVVHLLGDPNDVPRTETYSYELTRDGQITLATGEVLSGVPDDDDAQGAGLRAGPVEFAHLVNARGVTVEPVPISRQQRRRFERQRLVHPQVYFVHIGEGTTDRPGASDRSYHCRWLVRGHWRHFEDGSRTWVRPYIKGPAGAPWRGRPVYVLDPQEGR